MRQILLLLTACLLAGCVAAPFDGELPAPPGAQNLSERALQDIQGLNDEVMRFEGYFSDASAADILDFYRKHLPEDFSIHEEDEASLTMISDDPRPGGVLQYAVRVNSWDDKRMVVLMRMLLPQPPQ